MSEALPLALLALIVVLLAAMPWHRPHPNHQFMLELLRLLEDEPTNSCDSPLTHLQSSVAGPESPFHLQKARTLQDGRARSID